MPIKNLVSTEEFTKIKQLRELTGHGLRKCQKAIQYFDGNIKQAEEFLKIYSQAVCRKKENGQNWQLNDYVEAVKTYIK